MSTVHNPGYLPWDRNGNIILLQSELGKNKPSTFDLPEKDFTYGKKQFEDPEKADSLMYQWKAHSKSLNSREGKQKDFMQTNKKCLNNMLHTSKDFSKFRRSSTEFQKVREGSAMININLPEEGHTYGKPLEYEDPIKLLMANNYGETDKIARHTFYMGQQLAKKGQKRKLSCHITKNHNLVKEATARKMAKFDWQNKNQSPLWKLTKFGKVTTRIDTKSNRFKTLQEQNQRKSAANLNN